MELSAFAHFTQRNIKVIQPGLVYVIEWNAGGDPDDFQKDDNHADDNPANARERRKQRRERLKEKTHTAPTQIDSEHDDSRTCSTIYVA
jgi:OTU domain-containing protein 3